jgi:hypothetical protein
VLLIVPIVLLIYNAYELIPVDPFLLKYFPLLLTFLWPKISAV